MSSGQWAMRLFVGVKPKKTCRFNARAPKTDGVLYRAEVKGPNPERSTVQSG